ncbi:hypothetical protein NEOLEDRAFT_1054022 [Neolentinus lepideus HHB14362 ss-1]|uniref:Uncharacterized protein n=1 Tax=Neolentinus lepideus HHB14362 ss-1 TaxID=1314782 RepID=A0A165W5R4_9AGAM|nr:hypothetical protein NEOLEDRAFT_1054022 [Neolentinus lepideus HHB14362 ss-1]
MSREDSTSTPNIRDLFGNPPSSRDLAKFLVSLSASQDKPREEPEVHIYPDVVYFNYYSLGLSLNFTPVDGYKPQSSEGLQSLDKERLWLSGVDVYNKIETVQEQEKKVYDTYPLMPLILALPSENTNDKTEPSALKVTPKTTGKRFIECLGEPDRKGGGVGRGLGPNIWCEWLKHGIMIEFGGPEAKGPKAWETGKDALWQCITLFRPKDV